jgi:hypothetical protein
MATDSLWRIAMRLLRPAKSTSLRLELMSNEDLEHWLKERNSA